jgi:hypothetical protein
MIDLTMLTLFIYVPNDNVELKQFYLNRAEEHNNKAPGKYADSGFDLGMPTTYGLPSNRDFSVKLPLNVHCSMYRPDGTPQAYYLYPRSSIIKTLVLLKLLCGYLIQ